VADIRDLSQPVPEVGRVPRYDERRSLARHDLYRDVEIFRQKLALTGAMTTTRPQAPSRDRTALATPQRTGP
jgi:hypothetical protein